jgi:hypothetical protein
MLGLAAGCAIGGTVMLAANFKINRRHRVPRCPNFPVGVLKIAQSRKSKLQQSFFATTSGHSQKRRALLRSIDQRPFPFRRTTDVIRQLEQLATSCQTEVAVRRHAAFVAEISATVRPLYPHAVAGTSSNVT